MRRARRGATPLACARSGEWRHPVVGLWPVALRDDLRQALVVEDLRKIEVWTARHGVAIADWPTEPVDPFFNVNTPEDVAAAERIASSMQRDARRDSVSSIGAESCIVEAIKSRRSDRMQAFLHGLRRRGRDRGDRAGARRSVQRAGAGRRSVQRARRQLERLGISRSAPHKTESRRVVPGAIVVTSSANSTSRRSRSAT